MKKTAVRASRDIVWRKIDGEIIILSADGNAYYTLNDSGVRIWELLEAGNAPAEIIEAIVEEFGIARSIAEKDYNDLVGKLIKEHLVETHRSS